MPYLMVWNYFIENVRYARRVLEYSLRYSPSTRVANYSDSTALTQTETEKGLAKGKNFRHTLQRKT